jgi:hypothetical protein
VLDLTIRQGTAADADAIADLIAVIEPDKLVAEISREERRDRFDHYLDAGINAAFLAESRGRLVGELTLALGGPARRASGSASTPTSAAAASGAGC